ncbi:phosphatase PAP2 family protein [Gammaproteobacteria bacterium]|nr:phosphatase PAP2 family protein [Gammaproteobacteria bacterium]
MQQYKATILHHLHQMDLFYRIPLIIAILNCSAANFLPTSQAGTPNIMHYAHNLMSFYTVCLVLSVVPLCTGCLIWFCYQQRSWLGGWQLCLLKVDDFLKVRSIFTDLIMFILIAVFLYTGFDQFKHQIGHNIPFWLDLYLVPIDAWWLNNLPWHLFSHRVVLLFIDLVYSSGWFFITGFLLTWFILSTNRALKWQILMTYLLCWIILGQLLATLFASAGPAFLTHFFPHQSNPFQAILSHLASQPSLLSVQGQALLLDIYQGQEHVIGSAISAFPSLHVSMATLAFRLLRQYQRPFAIFGAMNLTIIFFGSALLAWHYILDSVAALLMTELIFFMVKKLTPKALSNTHS